MKIPIKVFCHHNSKAKLGEPFLCQFKLRNISEDVLSVYVSLGTEYSGMGQVDQPPFLIGGQSVCKIDLYPRADKYVFKYTLVPMKLGILELP